MRQIFRHIFELQFRAYFLLNTHSFNSMVINYSVKYLICFSSHLQFGPSYLFECITISYRMKKWSTGSDVRNKTEIKVWICGEEFVSFWTLSIILNEHDKYKINFCYSYIHSRNLIISNSLMSKLWRIQKKIYICWIHLFWDSLFILNNFRM